MSRVSVACRLRELRRVVDDPREEPVGVEVEDGRVRVPLAQVVGEQSEPPVEFPDVGRQRSPVGIAASGATGSTVHGDHVHEEEGPGTGIV